MSDIDMLVKNTAPTISEIVAVIGQLGDRLSRLENTLTVVDRLPSSAPLGALIRVRGDETGALYLGNGTDLALSKLVPAAQT